MFVFLKASHGSEDVLAKEEELEYTYDAIAEADHTSKVLEKMKHRAERTRNEMKQHLGGKQKEVRGRTRGFTHISIAVL